MSPSTSSERAPLLVPVSEIVHSGASVVSYTVSQQKCSNNTLKDRSTAKSTKRKLWFAVCLACAFFATELVAGYFANSLGKLSFPCSFQVL
jgi:zinc transporter 2/zinc transporter 4